MVRKVGFMMRCITQGGETSGGYTKKLIVEDKKQNIEFNTILVRIDILIETHIGKYLMAVQYQDILQAFKLKFMDGQLNLLIESLTLLGLAYQEQREKLPEFVGDIMTDILDDFSNAFFLVPQLIEKGLLSEKALQKVVSCYVQIQVN